MAVLSLNLEAFSEVLTQLGQRARALRLIRNLTQSQLAKQAGVGVATLHRFEKTGQISLDNALRISTALGAEEGFRLLFAAPPYATLDEALGLSPPRKRLRVRARSPERKKGEKP